MNLFLTRVQNAVAVLWLQAQSGVDFYNENNSEGGGSIIPFLGFMCSLFGILLLAIGVIRYVSAKRQFDMFFDQRNQTETHDKKHYSKEIKISTVFMIVGGVFLVLSFVLL